MLYVFLWCYVCFLKKNQNAPRPSEHPPSHSGGGNVKTFTWDASFFVFILSLKPRPFVQSSFDIYSSCCKCDHDHTSCRRAPLATHHVFLSFFSLLFKEKSECTFGDIAFSEYFMYHFRFLFVWRVIRRTLFPSESCFSTFVTTSWISVSLLYILREFINQSIIKLFQVLYYQVQ